jgi:hypothetical protein
MGVVKELAKLGKSHSRGERKRGKGRNMTKQKWNFGWKVWENGFFMKDY